MNELSRHWGLDPDIIFLNHGSFGATPLEVLAYQAEIRRRMERQPVQFFVRDLEELMEPAREAAARFVGAAVEDFVFVNNATTGVNSVLRSLDLQPGDELVVTDLEYNACRNALDFVAGRSGATVVVVPIALPLSGPEAVVDAITGAVTSATRLVLVDHVTSQTGIVLPIERIARAVRARSDARILVDGAHAAGMLDLNVEELGVDYYTGNFHKWVCSPKSGAFLWSRPEFRAGLRPLVISHGANRQFANDSDRFHFEFEWQGTSDPSALLAIPQAIAVMNSLVPGGWDEIRRRNHELVVAGRALLNEILDAAPLCPDSMIGSIASVRIADDPRPATTPLLPLDPLGEVVAREHRIEVPIFAFPSPPQRLLRISAQLYNEPGDYEALAKVLKTFV